MAATAILVGTVALGLSACGDDEDNDGSELNEEVESVESVVEGVGDEVEQQVDEGAEEDTEPTS